MLDSVYLKPCEIYISHEPVVVRTVLGSCVSVVMYSLKHNIGGICHAMLPTLSNVTKDDDIFKYVDSSIRYMADYFFLEAVPVLDIEVKVFGGADMFTSVHNGQNRMTIGRKNVKTALDTLNELGFRIVSSDTGGTNGRKLYFYSGDGKVYLKKIQSASGY